MHAQHRDNQLDLIAVTAVGLEAVVARELRQLGYEARIVGTGRVHFPGDALAVCRTNLWLRAADRILIQIGQFKATDFGQLFDQTRDLPWGQWLPSNASFPVTGRSVKSQLSSVPACQKIVKKAVVESLRAAHGVQLLDESGPGYGLRVTLLQDEATLTLDTTGPGLHKRGYGQAVGPSPLKETLAAAMVMLSFWRPERPLIDPFCGSGTIVIEAAMLGRNMAPGLNRSFDAEQWPGWGNDCWRQAREQAGELASPPMQQRILATDASEKAVNLARYHAENAGVADDIHFQQKEFSELSSKRKYGCVIANPPYGIRSGEEAEVRELHESMPLVLRRLPTWSFYLLSAVSNLEQLVGRKADRRRKLYNGRIECTLFQFYGPKPPRSQAAVAEHAADEISQRDATVEAEAEKQEDRDGHPRVIAASVGQAPTPAFGGLTGKAREQAELFHRRLLKQARHLRRWPTKRGITCFRLYDRDIPEIPLAVDRYEDHLHIAEYERPHDRDPAQHADWLDLMVDTASQTLDVPRPKIFVKYRQRQRGQSQYERRGKQGSTLHVHEGGLQFEVNLSEYLDTGLFLDHRITRAMVRDQSADTRFVNLFGYTGAFTVYAAAGGAKTTTMVDWSNTYVDWARKNMVLNGFTGSEHRFVRDDVMDYVRHLPPRPMFDLAVVDPPTYSNSKRTEADWDIQRDYVALLNELLLRMAPGGEIFFSTNFRRFKFDEAAIHEADVREISRQTVPEDFRNRRIHRCWRVLRRHVEPST